MTALQMDDDGSQDDCSWRQIASAEVFTGRGSSNPGDEVRDVGRIRTFAALRALDKARKAEVLQFLYESQLISKKPIIRLTGADLRKADLDSAVLRRSEIRGAYFIGASMQKSYLGDADLRGSDFSGADMSGADLENTDLSFAILKSTNLSKTDLRKSNLTGANLSRANLRGAKITQEQIGNVADIEKAKFSWNHKRGL